ncbi:hypothetical protein C9374_011479 [Naegleria lovaniensis]|uniref:BRCT domain-containing protein n=1 Tax=Naegleria lovaniensis TaxID=51637 RepID=A0AA88KRK4_NAELO|nr:uncharacterized protein C9374_011479 [Naegleria lovaniensis]KAG2392754.1 hypothetical protein C9374_011479 [Naegleria lovaniensis]
MSKRGSSTATSKSDSNRNEKTSWSTSQRSSTPTSSSSSHSQQGVIQNFKSLCFYLSPSIPESEREKLRKIIKTRGGSLSLEENAEEVTHIISVDMKFAKDEYLKLLNRNDDSEHMEKYLLEHQAEKPDRCIVSPQFIYNNDDYGAEDKYLLCYPFVFCDFVFTCTNKVAAVMPSIAFMVEYLGGKFIPEFNKEFSSTYTHVISSLEDTETEWSRFENPNILLLSIDWLKECFTKRSYIDEKDHLIGKYPPTYSLTSNFKSKNVFSNHSFIVINYPPTFISNIQRAICMAGGKVIHNKAVHANSKIDYLITRYAYSFENGFLAQHVTTAQWIDDCLRESKLIDTNEKAIYTPLKSNMQIPEFEGLKITVTGFKDIERNDMTYLIKQTGALYTGDLSKDNHYLIVNSSSNTENSKKVKKANDWGIPTLKKEFIFDSISEWKMVDIGPYLIGGDSKKRKHITALQSPSTSSEGSRKKTKQSRTPKVFQLSISNSLESRYEMIIQQLGGTVVNDEQEKTHHESITHLIASEIKRTLKYMRACAKGCWVLKTSYLDHSLKSSDFLDEEQYEWNSNEITPKGMWLGIPRKWRLYREKHKYGPFHDLVVYIHVTSSNPPASVLADIIKAGDGTVVSSLNSDVNLAIVNDNAKEGDSEMTRKIKRLEIPAVPTSFILDFFKEKETPSLEQYRLF